MDTTVHQDTVYEKEVMLIWNDKQRKLEVPQYPGNDDEVITVKFSLDIHTTPVLLQDFENFEIIVWKPIVVDGFMTITNCRKSMYDDLIQHESVLYLASLLTEKVALTALQQLIGG